MIMKFDDKDYLAEKIKFHRKKLGYTQAELAEMVNLSDQHISRIESGCYIPSLKSFFMLVSVLHIDLREFGFNVEKTNSPLKDKLIGKISNATDAELIFYENTLDAITKSLAQVKKQLLWWYCSDNDICIIYININRFWIRRKSTLVARFSAFSEWHHE